MRTRWKKTLISLAASLLLVFLVACTAAVVLLYTYDFNRFKPYLERTVEEAFGRQLTIAGDIRVEPGLPPVLSAENLQLQNAAWASRPEMMTLARIEVAVRLLPLLQRQLVLSRVELTQPDIRFEIGPSGAWNVVPETEKTGSRRPAGPPPVTVERLLIRDGAFQYHPNDATEYTLVLETFDLHRKMLSSNHKIDFKGSFGDEPLRLSGTLTQLIEFLLAEAALAFDLTADASSTRVSAVGRLQPQDAGFDLDSRVEAEGDAVLDVLRFFGIDAFPDFGPFQVNGAISGPLTVLAAEDVQLQAGGGGYPDTRIDGRIGDLNHFRDVALDFSCADERAASIEKVIGTALPLKGPFRVSGRFDVPAEDRYRFGDLQLILGENHLRGELVLDDSTAPLQMTVSLAGPRIDARPLDVSFPAPPETYADLGPVTLELVGTAPFTKLSAEKIQLQAGSPDRIEMTLNGSIDNLPDLEGLMLAWRIRGSRLQEFAALLGQSWPVSGKFDSSGKLRSPASNRYRMDEIKMAAAGSDLQGTFEMDLGGQQPVVAASLDSRVLDLRPFLDANDSDGRSVKRRASSTKAPWFPTAYQKMQARIDYRAATVRTPDFTVPEIKADLNLQGGKLVLTVSGPRLPDIVPEVKISELGGYHCDLEIADVNDPSPAAAFALKTDSAEVGFVQIQGTVAGLPALYPLQANVLLKFPDAAGLEALLEYSPRLQVEGPLAVEARLEMSSRNVYQWRRIDLRAGKSELSGDLLMDFSGARPQIQTGLRLPLLDLPALLPAGETAPNPKETDSEKPADIRRIIAGAVQPWARALQPVDVAADVTVGKIRFADFEIHKLKIDGRLDQGNLQLRATSQSAPDVARKAGIEGLPDLGPLGLDLHVRASGDDLALRSLELSAGTVDAAQINLQGKSRSLADLAEAELQVRIAGKDIAALKPFFESFPDYEGAFRFEGRLESPQARRLRVDDAALQVGDSQMSGDLAFDLSGSRPEISATLKSPKLDLIPLALWLRPEPPPEIDSPAVVKSDRVIPDAPLPLEALRVLDGRVQLHADRILLPALDMQNFEGEIRIQDGHVLADPITFQSGEGSFEGRTVLRQVPDGAVISLNLRVEDIELKAMRSAGEIKSLFTGLLNVEADLTGRGRSFSELLGSLNGRWVDIASDGRIANRYFAPFLLNPNVRATILRSVNPAYKMQDYTEFNCRANQFEIEAGVAAWSGFLDTDLVYLAAGGTIDLSTERIDIAANPRPKEGVGFQQIGQVTFNLAELTKPFKITGTLADPRIGLAPTRAFSTIAKALGGFLLLGPVGLAAAFADVSIGKDNSCIKALENFASSKEGSPPEKSSDENRSEKMTDEVKDWFDGEE